MKDTEMFDAIAHIDEYLVDRCIKDKPSSKDVSDAAFRRRTWLSIAGIAAALAIAFGLIAFLHIGGEKPDVKPIADPTEAVTEAPTEAPTPAPTEEPEAILPAVMVKGQLYKLSDMWVAEGEAHEPYDGTVASAVPEDEYPTDDDTANSESMVGSPYMLGAKGLYVKYNGGWKIFYPYFEGYALQEAGLLQTFFETEDEQGVKNGEKLFENYKTNDPSSWHGPAGIQNPSAVVRDENGLVTGLHLFPAVQEPVQLNGILMLDGFEKLGEIELGSGASFVSLNVTNCPVLDKVTAAEPLIGAYVYSGTLGGGVFLSADHITCVIPGETAGTDHTVGVNAYVSGGEGMLRLTASKGQNSVIELLPAEGYSITGWYEVGSSREVFSRSSVLDLTEDPAFEFSPTGPDDEPRCIGALVYRSVAVIPAYPGEAPTASPELARLQPGETLSADIDGDGREDTILLTVTDIEEGYRSCAVTITLAAHPDSPIVLDPVVDRTYEVSLRLLDCDVTDNRKELLLMCLNNYDESCAVCCIRINAEGAGADVFKTPYGVVFTDAQYWELEDPTGNFDAENGIPLAILTNILDTQLVTGRLTVTDEGFMLITPFTYGIPYPDPNSRGWRELKSDMEATLLDASGAEQGRITLPAGTRMVPYMTDAATWLTLTTEDGRTVRVDIEIAGGKVFINGSVQEEYFEVAYAG